MGKGRKIGFVIAVVVAVAGISVIAMNSMGIEASDPGKYSGLTEHQIAMVKTLEDNCRAAQPYEFKFCEDRVNNLIAKYRAENGS